MILLHVFDFSLPLQNPILIFSLILFIILFAPIILNKFQIPYLIGLIIAGVIIGPNGLNLMLRDSSIILFGTVGLLYIMFLAGLEIDLLQFKKNSGRSIVFGLYTFIIPMGMGTSAGYYILGFSLPTSILLASMFASHTLIAYPLISKMGLAKNRAVNVAVGGTMITDTLALLVLAVIVGMSTGVVDNNFWIRLGVSVTIFTLIVVIGFPLLTRWFFKHYDDNISQYIFVLGLVFLGAFLAEMAGIEGIIGAFLAGLAINRLVPHTSPLMNRIEFVGNALFIPFFLIGVGMLIDFRVFFTDIKTIIVALVMITIASSAKYAAAWLTQKTFKYTNDERRLIYGLSNAQAAATLAAVLVGYNVVLNKEEIEAAALIGNTIEPIRLLNESILNGTILMILVTCTIASIAAQKGASNIANSIITDEAKDDGKERILIASNNNTTTEELTNLSLLIKSKKNKSGLYGLHVIDENNTNDASEKNAKSILSKAALTASATDNNLTELLRYDTNITNGLYSVVKEHKITDIILGLHDKNEISDSFLGKLTEGILTKCNTTTFIYKPIQPLSTIKRHLVFIPVNAEKEVGFPFWIYRIWSLAKNTGAKIIFYASPKTLTYIKEVNNNNQIQAEFIDFTDWEDFLVLSREVQIDDNMIIILSRTNTTSYHKNMAKIPSYLNKYFNNNNFLIIYPIQLESQGITGIDLKAPNLLEPLEKIDSLGKSIVNVFKKKK